ncbi:MAG: carboxypeptidase-like regulatory domain-containing protein, partial [Sphingomonadales bacterium]
MIKIILLLTLLLSSNLFFAQNMKVSGRLVDTSGTQPIHQASIMAIHLRDSVLVAFTRSNVNGEFQINNLPLDSFQLLIEHSNWTPRSV